MALTYVKSSGLDTTGDFVANSLTLTANIISGNANLGNTATSNYFVGNGVMTFAVGNINIAGGTSGQYLKTDGSGNLSWDTPAGGSGGGASVIVSNTAPTGSSAGDMWFDSETGELNVFYVDTWVSITQNAPQLSSLVDNFTGNGVATDFTLSSEPVSINYTFVSVGGILQPRTAYSITGNVLSFTSAVPSNSPVDVTVLGGATTPISAASTVLANAQPNITSVGTLTSLTSSGNITANYFIGNGSSLTGISASSATTAATVTTNAQPNITSVGTLTSLSISGNITSGNATLGNLVTANYFSGSGNLIANIQAANISGQVANSLVAGTVYTNAQPNITSLGTLTSLSVAGLISETFATKTNATGTVDHDASTVSTFLHTTPSANFTANFTNVPTTANKIIMLVLVISQGASVYLPTTMQIAGSTQTVLWLGGSAPSGSANKYDVISYSLFRVGSSWTVFGSASSFG